MSAVSERAIAELARRQHGTFTIHDAQQIGVGETWLRRRVQRGLYRRAAPQAYLIAGTPPTWEQAVMIAVQTEGPAAASHLTAAYLWGLAATRPESIEISTRRWKRRARDFTVHESRDLRDRHITTVAGIPTTRPARTLVDVAGTRPWLAESMLGTGIRRRVFELDDVALFVDEVARRGRRGVGVVRPLIEARRSWDGISESELEDEFRRVLDRHALPQPTAQLVVADSNGRFVARADFAYSSHRLIIELDGEAYHMDRQAFRHDRSRQNRLELLGWRVLRYTWWDLTEDESRVVAEIRAALGRPT